MGGNDEALELRLVGRPAWARAGSSGAPLSRLDAALLAVLAIDGEQPRERLAAWLWPEAAPGGGLLNLRQRVHRLRRDTGHTVIDGGPVLRLAEGVRTDVDEARPWPDAGELLGGLDYGDREALDDWVQAARERGLRRQLDAQAATADRLEAEGRCDAALEVCQRMLDRQPMQETVWRQVMRLHHRRGDRAAAVEAFERFERLARDEHGLRPSPATQELLRAIEHGVPATASPLASGQLPPALRRPPRLVGREAALAAVRRAGAEGRASLVLAPAGAGKSRLLADLVQEKPGALVVAAQPGDAAQPYALAGRVMDAVLARFAPALSAGTRDELARIRPTAGAAPPSPGQPGPIGLAVADALAAAAAQGLARLALDDLQSADEASLMLLRRLAAQPPEGVTLVFAARPAGEGDGWRAWLGDSSRIEPVRLTPWSEDELRDLLASIDLPGLGPALAPLLLRHAGGWPFPTLETLKRLALDGVPDAGAAWPLPATVHALIARRVASLSALAQSLLALGAVAGRPLPLPSAERLLAQPPEVVACAAVELEQAQLWEAGACAHDLVRQAVLAEMPGEQARAWHATLAREGEATARPAVTVAEHWLAAGDPRGAAPWLARAAERAGAIGRSAEQAALLDKAADAWQAAGDELRSLDAACDALDALSLSQGSEDLQRRIGALEARAATPAQRARLALARALAAMNLARYAEAQAAAEEALQFAGSGHPARIEAAAVQGRAIAMQGQAATAIRGLQAALGAPGAIDDPAHEHALRAALAHARYIAGDGQDAIEQQQRALQLSRDRGRLPDMAEDAGNLAMLHYMAGRTAEAWRYAQEADRLHSALESIRTTSGTLNRVVLGKLAAHFGRFDIARPALESAAATDVAYAGATVSTLALAALAGLWIWLGQPARAVQPLPVDPQTLHPLARLGWWQVQGRATAMAGLDPDPAQAEAARIIDAHPELLDDPAILLDWSRSAEPEEAARRLLAAARRCRAGRRSEMARCVELKAVPVLRRVDPEAAARLARQLRRELPRGVFSATHPAEAWVALAEVLDDPSCLEPAHRWLLNDALPHVAEADRAAFLSGHPVHRMLAGL